MFIMNYMEFELYELCRGEKKIRTCSRSAREGIICERNFGDEWINMSSGRESE